MTYDEGMVPFTYEGRTFEARGAVVTDDHIVAYLGKGGVLTDCGGRPLGTYQIVSSWPTPRSCYSSHMHQVEAKVKVGNEVITYTGRSGGVGLIYKGRRKKT